LNPSSPNHLHIEAHKGFFSINFAEIWQYRELLYFLTWRDIKIRYKQTVLGMAWAILQPLLSMVVFTIFFGNLANIPSDGIPYPIFTFTALVPWTFFATGLSLSSNSLVTNANLLKKVYFPRLLIPFSTILAGLVDFVLAFIILILLMLGYGIVPTVQIIWLPVFMVLAFLTASGVGIWLAAMNVQFRDVRYAIPFLTQLWLFITPIAYPSSLIKDDTLKALYGINPMAGVVEGFRWALLGVDSRPTLTIIASYLVALIVLGSGLFYFRQMEKTFADVV
jgi:lipopolysaccharide transport system permease protein